MDGCTIRISKKYDIGQWANELKILLAINVTDKIVLE